MKIKRLSIKNFIGIQELDLVAGKVNLIKGRVGKGKTTILEAIEKGFTNQDRRPRVIREGTDQAIILIETDDGLSIRRGITDKGTSLTVTNKDKFKAPSPQKLLSELTGRFSFNPVDFIKEDEKTQTEILLSLANIRVTPEDVKVWTGSNQVPVDYSQHGLQVIRDLHSLFYDVRRDANAEVKAVKAEAESITVPAEFDPEPYRNVGLRELYDELKAAQDNNDAISEATDKLVNLAADEEAEKQRAEAGRDSVRAAAASERRSIQERTEAAIQKARYDSEAKKGALREKIAQLEAELSQVKDELEQAPVKLKDNINTFLKGRADLMELVGSNEKSRLEGVDVAERKALVLIEQLTSRYEAIVKEKQPIDTAPPEQKVREFEEKKALVRDYDRKKAVSERLKQSQEEAARLDNIIKTLAAKPAELMAKANLPIAGMGIDDKGNVTINGRPIKSLSGGEQIKLALQIAKAATGELKLVCIDGFERIDKSAQAEFLKQIKDDEFQYFITEVSDEETVNVKVG